MSDDNQIFNFVNDSDPEVDYTGASAKQYIDKYTNRPEDAITKEGIQNSLSIMGLVLDPFDWLNAAIYWHAGDKLNAALYGSGIGILGVGAIASKGAKAITGKQIMKGTKDLQDSQKKLQKMAQKEIAEHAKPRLGKELNHKDVMKEFNLHSLNFSSKYWKDLGPEEASNLLKMRSIWEQSKTVLKKELMSNESYKKWRSLMEKSDELSGFYSVSEFNKRGGRYPTSYKDFYSESAKINSEAYNMGLYSKEWYAHWVESTINNTRIIPVSGKINNVYKRFGGSVETGSGGVGGFFSHIPWNKNSTKGAIYVDKALLNGEYGPSVLVHELKHAVQSPFMPTMKKVYADVIETLNTQWKQDRFNPRLGHSQKTLLNRLQSDKYIMEPWEVSARLSEIRSGLPNYAHLDMFGTNSAKINNVYSHWLKDVFHHGPKGLGINPGARGFYNKPFNPRDLSRLDKSIWGVTGGGLTLNKFDEIFDEE